MKGSSVNHTLSNVATHSNASSDRYAPGVHVDWIDLIDSVATLPSGMDLDRAQSFFRDYPEIAFVAVLRGSQVVGLASELAIVRKLTLNRGLGHCIYAKTPIDRHLQESPLIITRGQPVLEVLRLVMSRQTGFFDDIILVDENRRFLGLIQTQTMMRLQHRILETQVTELEDLTDQLNQRNSELAQARDAAMEAAEMKASFLANMSHEIRTPLNGILGMVRILMRTALDSTQRRYASTVLNSANALLTILNDILDFSKIEAGKMEFERISFNLADLIEEAVQLNSERAREKKIDIYSWIDPTSPSAFISDPTRIRQVVLNLVSNAVKFTEKGEVVVRLDLVQQDQESATIRVSIKDTGVGIAPDVQKRLFSAFEQGDRSTSRKFGGTGLGLAISKRLVDLLGGTIGCESELGKGSTFYFELTLPKDPAVNATEQLKHEELWGVRVLVVDDSPSFCAYLTQHLNRWQVITRSATSVDEAAELARRQAARNLPFDASIIDFHLPGQDGMELARSLAQDPTTASMGHVILAAFENEVSTEAAKVGHVAAVLAKPVKPTELLEGLLKAIRSRPDQAKPSIVLSAPDETTPTPPSVPVQAASPVLTPATLAVSAAEQDCPPLNLLLVEDSEVNREVAQILLSAWGHTVTMAEHGLRALEILERQFFDCVLMDCQMPELDGYETTRRIRLGTSPDIPKDIYIIAMTANAMPGDREVCLAAGMNDYVGKPIDEGELLAALKKAAAVRAQVRSADVEEPVPEAVPVHEGPPPLPLNVAAANGHGPEEKPPQVVVPAPPVNASRFPPRLASLFVQETRKRHQEILEAVEANDLESILRVAHTIKGTAGNFGADDLYSLCREIEGSARAGNMEDIRAALPRFRHVVEDVCAAWAPQAELSTVLP